MTLVKRTSSIPSANAISLGLTQAGLSPKGYFVTNLSASGTILYIADQTTAGSAPTVATNITADCTNYWTIPSGSEQYIATRNPANLFGQVSTGTAGIAQITPVN